jgi:hypothetical protein
MKTSTQIAIAGSAIKPPATQSEIIEAMAIRRRDQMYAAKNEAEKTRKTLEAKFQIVAAEEMPKGGVPEKDYSGDVYNFHAVENNGHVSVKDVTCRMTLRPSKELTALIHKITDAKRTARMTVPSLHEIKSDIRAEIKDHTPAGQRVISLLKTPESSKAIDSALDKIYGAAAIVT